jgi:hypothetical protein
MPFIVVKFYYTFAHLFWAKDGTAISLQKDLVKDMCRICSSHFKG